MRRSAYANKCFTEQDSRHLRSTKTVCRGQNARTVFKSSLTHRKNLCVPTPFLKYLFITTLALLIELRDAQRCTHTNREVKLQFRKKTLASYVRSPAWASTGTRLYTYNSYHENDGARSHRASDIRPMNLALRVSQGAISLLLIFAAPRSRRSGHHPTRWAWNAVIAVEPRRVYINGASLRFATHPITGTVTIIKLARAEKNPHD